MIRSRVRPIWAMVMVLALIAAACGSDTETTTAGDGDTTTTAPEESEAAETTEAAPDTTEAAPETTAEPMVVNLRFQSLAWQEESIEANIALVDQWNAENPGIQVEYVQGSWDSVQDQLLTEFETGEAPDLVHYESTAIGDFARRGYLVDLSSVLSDDFVDSIRDSAWDTVSDGDGVYGVPFLLESSLFFANKTIFDDAGVDLPTIDDPWTWDEFQAAALELTTPDRKGLALPFKSPTNRVLNLSLAFGGDFFSTTDGVSTTQFGDAEKEVASRIYDMLYVDESAATDSLGFGSSDVLPGFFGGEYAMVTSGVWFRQQISSQAPDGFDWVTLPPLVGDSQAQGSGSQTISMSIDSQYPDEAAQFLEFFLSPEGMAALAKGDWLLPTSDAAGEALEALTGGADGWDVAVESGRNLIVAPFQEVAGFGQWKSEVANPAFQEYFADQIDIDELGRRLVEDGQDVLDSAA